MATVKATRNPEKVVARVGSLLQRYKVNKFVCWSVSQSGALAFGPV